MQTTGRHARMAAIAALALLAGVSGVMTTTSAWFSAARTGSGTVTAGTLSIAGPGQQGLTDISVDGAIPMADADASTAPSQWITVGNSGTLAFDWTLALFAPRPVAPLTADAAQVFRFQLFDEAGTAISPVGRLMDAPATAEESVPIARGTDLAPAATTRIRLRTWLETTAGNDLQGARVDFGVVVQAQQRSAPTPPPLLPTAADRFGTSSIARGGEPCVVDTAGVLRCWASTGYGRLGDGTYLIGAQFVTSTPTVVPLPAGIRVARPFSNHGDTCVVTTDRSAYCTGYGAGAGPGVSAGVTGSPWGSTSRMTRVAWDRPVVDMALGGANGLKCLLDADGRVACWGNDHYRQVGSPGGSANAPRLVQGVLAQDGAAWDVVDMQITQNGSVCALTRSARIACWGWDQFGAGVLGTGAFGALSPEPVLIATTALPADDRPVRFEESDGASTLCVRSEKQSLLCWGRTTSIDAAGRPVASPAPVVVAVPGHARIDSPVFTGAGARTGLCFIETGAVFCMGSQSWGELGLGSGEASRAAPTRVLGLLQGRSAVQLVANRTGVCAVLDDGRLTCWGSAGSGTLGDSITRDVRAVVSVPETFASVVAAR